MLSRFTEDERKVTVRDCGFFDADECTSGWPYEVSCDWSLDLVLISYWCKGTEAVGQLCHCHGDACNSAPAHALGPATALLTAGIAGLLGR